MYVYLKEAKPIQLPPEFNKLPLTVMIHNKGKHNKDTD